MRPVDNCTVEDLKTFAPDEKIFLGALPDATLLGTLRTKFDLNPLLVSCWACLLSQVPEDQRRRFGNQTAADLRRLALSCRQQHDDISPNMATLSEEVGEAQAASKRKLSEAVGEAASKRKRT